MLIRSNFIKFLPSLLLTFPFFVQKHGLYNVFMAFMYTTYEQNRTTEYRLN